MSIYVSLADHIDHVFQNGFSPHDEERPFVLILKKMLTEEEARLMCCMTDQLMTVNEIVERAKTDPGSTDLMLKHLRDLGMIYESVENETEKYRLMPFIPGIFESILKDVKDPEIARLQDLFIREIHERRGENVIPVNRVISTEVVEASASEIDAYLDSTDRYALMDCICRKSRAVDGHACGHPIRDMCIVLGEYADYYVRIGNAHRASRKEVEKVLRRAEQLGLHHEFYPIEGSRSVFLCNCCTCGCMFMALAGRIRAVTDTDSSVTVDPVRCVLCGACISECPGDVFYYAKDRTRVLTSPAGCYGCRLCLHICPSGAVRLRG